MRFSLNKKNVSPASFESRTFSIRVLIRF